MRYAKIITAIAFVIIGLSGIRVYAYGEDAAAVDENFYIKDTVPVDDTYACQVGNTSACEVPVLLDKTTKKIAYYWSSAGSKWIAAGDQQTALQALYDKRADIRGQRQLKEMQQEMDRRRLESMDESMHDTPAHR